MRKSILLLFIMLMLSAAAARAYDPYPVAIIHAPSNIYAGEQIEFDGSDSYDSSGPLIWYVWSVNGVQKLAGSDADLFYHSFTLPPGVSEEQVEIELCVYNTFPYEDCTSVMRTVKQKPGHYYYLTDHLGSVRATVNASGQLVGYDDYYPFGGQMPGRSMNMANPNDLYKFTGHERDTEAGIMLDFMNARTYDPEIGRFLQRDPILFEMPPNKLIDIHDARLMGFSPYNYTYNNPLIFIDPDGRKVVPVQFADKGSFREAWSKLKEGDWQGAAGEAFRATVYHAQSFLSPEDIATDLVPGAGLAKQGSKLIKKGVGRTAGGINNLKTKQLKKQGINAEAAKEGLVAEKAGRFNIGVDKNTGEVVLTPVKKGSSPNIPTGQTLEDLRNLFPLD